MFKKVIQTMGWCVLASFAGYILLPGIVSYVGAVVAPLSVAVHAVATNQKS